MSLFKRKKEPEASSCPRCNQRVTDADGLVCPACGWDLGEAYQGPPVALAGARGPIEDDTPSRFR